MYTLNTAPQMVQIVSAYEDNYILPQLHKTIRYSSDFRCLVPSFLSKTPRKS